MHCDQNESRGIGAYHFFAVESQSTSDLSLAIFVGDAFCNAFLFSVNGEDIRDGSRQTFVKTAMDAYEFPKLMPTIGGVKSWMGDSALPFGIGPALGGMLATSVRFETCSRFEHGCC